MIVDADIVVFDFETSGLDPNHHEAIQVAGKAYNAKSLEPYSVEQGGEFCSLMKPLYPERADAKALSINKKSLEMLAEAPDQKLVWNQFIDWVNRWNRRKSKFTAPIAAGKNIRAFDMEFVRVLNDLHSPKKSNTILFSARHQIDLEDLVYHWLNDDKDLSNMKMDTLRDYFGLSHENSHDALTDVRQTGDLIMRFMKLHRELKNRKKADGSPLIKFRTSVAA